VTQQHSAAHTTTASQAAAQILIEMRFSLLVTAVERLQNCLVRQYSSRVARALPEPVAGCNCDSSAAHCSCCSGHSLPLQSGRGGSLTTGRTCGYLQVAWQLAGSAMEHSEQGTADSSGAMTSAAGLQVASLVAPCCCLQHHGWMRQRQRKPLLSPHHAEHLCCYLVVLSRLGRGFCQRPAARQWLWHPAGSVFGCGHIVHWQAATPAAGLFDVT
jgi:hypothetical protein